MSKKRKVRFCIESRHYVRGTIELTDDEYIRWRECIDSARNDGERELIAQDLVEASGVCRLDGDIEDEKIVKFELPRPRLTLVHDYRKEA